MYICYICRKKIFDLDDKICFDVKNFSPEYCEEYRYIVIMLIL